MLLFSLLKGRWRGRMRGRGRGREGERYRGKRKRRGRGIGRKSDRQRTETERHRHAERERERGRRISCTIRYLNTSIIGYVTIVHIHFIYSRVVYNVTNVRMHKPKCSRMLVTLIVCMWRTLYKAFQMFLWRRYRNEEIQRQLNTIR